jgi:hypothetical protein
MNWIGEPRFLALSLYCARYSINRSKLCPLDPRVHCFSDKCRSRIMEVMRYSGKCHILHGRFDLIL